MKASLLAITISSVLAAPTFAAPYQVDVELANQQTLQLIDGQMKAVDASVQYKLNEQYANATPGTTATIDDVTYEKQSNGTWAAVGAASAALVAGILNSSSNNNDRDALPDIDFPIEEQPGGIEKHHVQVTPYDDSATHGQLKINGEMVSEVYITDDGQVVLDYDSQDRRADFEVVQSNDDGTYVRISQGTQAGQLIHINDNGVISKASDSDLIKPSHPNETLPNGNEKNHIQVIQHEDSSEKSGSLMVNGKDVGTVYITDSGQVVLDYDSQDRRADFEVVQSNDDGTYVRISQGTQAGQLIHINDNGVISKASDSDLIKPAHPNETLPNGNEKNHIQVIQHEDSSEKSGSLMVNGKDVGTIYITDSGQVVLDYDSQDRRADFEVVQSNDDGTYVRISQGTQAGQLIHINDNGVISKASDSDLVQPSHPNETLPNGNEKHHIQVMQHDDTSEKSGSLMVNGKEVGTVYITDSGQVALDYDSKDRSANFKVVTSNDEGAYVRIYKDDNAGQLIHINTEGVISKVAPKDAGSVIQSIDRNKLQSIDPAKLQKAKSAIQQRLRG